MAALLVASAACSLLPSPLPAPTQAPAPAPTALPLYRQVTLTARTSTEHGQPYDYTITLRTPVLVGSDDPHVLAFNSETAGIVNEAVAKFKQDLANRPPTPVSVGSFFDVRFDQVSPPGAILSLKFEMTGYVTGAAHPSDVSRTVNYDLELGKDLQLSDLFTPASNYLGVISDYCIFDLKTRNIAFPDFSAGAAPKPDNYRNWNITRDGLLITFDEYQVAPYAAGPQTVVVPYDRLGPLILKPGPLTPYLP